MQAHFLATWAGKVSSYLLKQNGTHTQTQSLK